MLLGRVRLFHWSIHAQQQQLVESCPVVHIVSWQALTVWQFFIGSAAPANVSADASCNDGSMKDA